MDSHCRCTYHPCYYKVYFACRKVQNSYSSYQFKQVSHNLVLISYPFLSTFLPLRVQMIKFSDEGSSVIVRNNDSIQRRQPCLYFEFPLCDIEFQVSIRYEFHVGKALFHKQDRHLNGTRKWAHEKKRKFKFDVSE